VEESDRKAWIRYVPPRWIWQGAAICAVPSEVSRAMLRGWHAHNGVSLGNPRLGFVCTGQAVDGQPGLEGYYLEHDHDLSPEERLRFSPGEEAPPFDPARAPRVEGAEWPPERLAKVVRNYAMDYVRGLLPELVATFGPAEARALGGAAGTLIGMQYYAETAPLLGVTAPTAAQFAAYLVAFGDAQGDTVRATAAGDAWIVTQTSWRLMEGVAPLHPAVFDAWNALWEGALAVHDRRLALVVERRLDWGDDAFVWRVRPRAPRRS